MMSLAVIAQLGPLSAAQVHQLTSVAEFIAKTLAALAGAWAFVEKVMKPYIEWRQRSFAASLRMALAPELALLQRLADQEDGRAKRANKILLRQELTFEETDMLLDIVLTHTDRLDETNDLLDAVGFSAERRQVERADSAERRRHAELMLEALERRRTERRRNPDMDLQ